MKAYYNQNKISSSFAKFFKNFSISKPHLKNICFIITAMICAESVVLSDISRKLKDDFSLINLESIERRFRRFFSSFSSFAYSFYNSFISHIIFYFNIKHSDKKIHISFDHMFVRDKFTILLFSLRIGKQGIPLWFRCFKGKHNPDAYSMNLINEGISYCANLFADKNYHIIRNIKPLKYSAKVLKDVYYTRKLFKTNIVVSNYSNTDEPWYLITNDDPSRAIKNYSFRFGSIESIFKSQKSNGFRLESTNTQKIEHFISLFTIMCIALVWLTIIGVDYVKNKHHYHLKFRDVKKRKNQSSRVFSFFNLGLTIFNLCYYNWVNFILKFNFVLYLNTRHFFIERFLHI